MNVPLVTVPCPTSVPPVVTFWRLMYISTGRPSNGAPLIVLTVPMTLKVFPLSTTGATEEITVTVAVCAVPDAGVVVGGNVVVVVVVGVEVGVVVVAVVVVVGVVVVAVRVVAVVVVGIVVLVDAGVVVVVVAAGEVIVVVV